MIKQKITIVVSICFILIFSSNAFAESSTVPDWIKNNAMWWAEGKISEQEYLNAIQYLIENKIIKIQIVPELFQSSPSNILVPSDDDRAISYIVRLSGGELKDEMIFSTFSRVELGDDLNLIKPFHEEGISDYFILESLPSKDKLEFYNIVSQYLKPGKQPELFDVSIDVITGDSSVLITVNYSKCKIVDYTPYSQEIILFYSFSKEMQEEIRDRTTVYCSGLDVEIFDPQQVHRTNFQSKVPSKDDRVISYVVHFFGPEFSGVYSLNSFSKFFPSVNLIETPYVTFTKPGNPFEGSPQFVLESLPSKDKKELYQIYSKYINPGREPFPFDVSIDLITGDGTILQRWNYVDCELTDYQTFVDESIVTFPFKSQGGPEIRDRSDFSCIGIRLDVPDEKAFEPTPIKDPKSLSAEKIATGKVSEILSVDDYAQSYKISIFGGELTQVYFSDSVQKIVPLSRDRGPLTPLHHTKQYDFGFLVESLPNKERTDFYKFMSRYLNPGKAPEPFDFSIDTITGDGTTLHRIKYTNCEAIDLAWYLQDHSWIYQFSGKQQEEIREKYFFYCEGIRIDFPQ